MRSGRGLLGATAAVAMLVLAGSTLTLVAEPSNHTVVADGWDDWDDWSSDGEAGDRYLPSGEQTGGWDVWSSDGEAGDRYLPSGEQTGGWG